jgi:hypothetical protein
MIKHWKSCIGIVLAACLVMGYATPASSASGEGLKTSHKHSTTTSSTVPKPSQSDILACDDFNTDFAQLVNGSTFIDVNVLQAITDGAKASDPGIRLAAHELAVQLGQQALRSGAPTETYELFPLTWALFQDVDRFGSECNRFDIGPP